MGTGTIFIKGRPYDYVEDENGNATLTFDGHSATVRVNELNDWLSGKFIQDAMPSASVDDREFLITGLSPTKWKEIFGNEEEDL